MQSLSPREVLMKTTTGDLCSRLRRICDQGKDEGKEKDAVKVNEIVDRANVVGYLRLVLLGAEARNVLQVVCLVAVVVAHVVCCGR